MDTNRHRGDSDEKIVRSLLRVAGLAPSEEEIRQLVFAYPDHRRAVDRLFAVPMPKEECPQPIFGFEEDAFNDSGT